MKNAKSSFEKAFNEIKSKSIEQKEQFNKKTMLKKFFGINTGKYRLELLNNKAIKSLLELFYITGVNDEADYIIDIFRGQCDKKGWIVSKQFQNYMEKEVKKEVK